MSDVNEIIEEINRSNFLHVNLPHTADGLNETSEMLDVLIRYIQASKEREAKLRECVEFYAENKNIYNSFKTNKN